MGQNFRWRVPPSKAWQIPVVVQRWEDAVNAELLYWAPQIEADMKRNASWEDRTSNARQTLNAFVHSPRTGVLALVAKQQMTYGVQLETKYGGRYAIVLPTLQLYYDRIWQGIKGKIE